MANGMGSLYIGSSGLRTSQNALNTTANNLANVDTTGYVRQQAQSACTREFKVRHTPAQTGLELNLIVDCGGRVCSTSISHRVYGRITVELDIRSRQDVLEFLQAFEDSASTVLSTATDGYHYHLVEAATTERLDLIEKELQEHGFLAPLQPWEK